MESNDVLPIIFVVIVVGLMVTFTIVTIDPAVKSNSFCLDKGYDYHSYDNAEPGYVICCEYVYRDHVKVDDYCHAYNVDEVFNNG